MGNSMRTEGALPMALWPEETEWRTLCSLTGRTIFGKRWSACFPTRSRYRLSYLKLQAGNQNCFTSRTNLLAIAFRHPSQGPFQAFTPASHVLTPISPMGGQAPGFFALMTLLLSISGFWSLRGVTD